MAKRCEFVALLMDPGSSLGWRRFGGAGVGSCALHPQHRALGAGHAHTRARFAVRAAGGPDAVADLDPAFAAADRLDDCHQFADQAGRAVVEIGVGRGHRIVHIPAPPGPDRDDAERGEDQQLERDADRQRQRGEAGDGGGDRDPDQEDAGDQHLRNGQQRGEDQPGPMILEQG